MTLAVGTRIGPYEVDQLLGSIVVVQNWTEELKQRVPTR
jgi:hypothetical protein